jgi:hypothetical protein
MHIAIGEANDAIPVRFEPGSAGGIVLGLIGFCVRIPLVV